MLHAGTCPVCDQGVRGVRVCHDHAVLLCDECESVWLDPGDEQRPVAPPMPDLPCPVCRNPLYGAETAWADAGQIDSFGWTAAIDGEVDTPDPEDAVPPPLKIAVLPHTDDCPWAAAVKSAPQSVTADGDAEALLLTEPFAEEAIAAALEAGHSVMAMMPWAESLKTVRELASLAAEKRVTLAPLVGWTSHPRTAAITRTIGQESFGGLSRLVCGVSHSGGTNAIDALAVAAWFFDGPPDRIQAVANGKGIAAVLTFGQSTAVLDMAGQLPNRQWVELVGANASAVCDDLLTPWTDGPSRFWVHGDRGKQSEEVVLPADGRVEAVASLYRAVRTAEPIANEWAVIVHEILHRVYEQVEDQAGESLA